MAKRPAFQFYPGDWRKDVELRACSLAARGLWIDLMCVAHECEPYGHLTLNGSPMTLNQIAGQIGKPAAEIKRLLTELLNNGVARKTEEGVIYSKRMVDDERIRNARAEGGKAGAEFGEKGASHGIKGGRPTTDKGGNKTPLKTPLPNEEKPPPSSSSSSSSSSSNRESARAFGKIPMRQGWQPDPEALRFCATASGISATLVTQPVLAEFVTYWAEEQAVNTERQWCQKLLQTAQRTASRTAPRKPESSLDEIMGILRSGLPPEEDDHEQSA